MRRLALGALAVAGTLALAGPAHADVAEWTANQSSAIVDADTVRLEGTNTSVETADLGIEVTAGDEISFHYELADGAQCTGGAPRVFIIVTGVNTNSWDQLLPAGKQCGTDGVVTFTAGTTGTIGAAGAVYDNGGVGHVLVSDLTIADEKVLFVEPEPEPSESASPSPSAEPSAEPVDCVDVNTADAETLTRLKHVDADRAAQILALRPFTSVDDLGRVDGLLAGGPRLAELVAGGDGFLPLCPIAAPPAATSSAAPSTTAPAAGGLPITGAPLTGLAIGGVVLLGAGTGLMLARRRRRFVA